MISANKLKYNHFDNIKTFWQQWNTNFGDEVNPLSSRCIGHLLILGQGNFGLERILMKNVYGCDGSGDDAEDDDGKMPECKGQNDW